jgi:hypothetical protein
MKPEWAMYPVMPVLRSEADISAGVQRVCLGPILLQKSKIGQPENSRES